MRSWHWSKNHGVRRLLQTKKNENEEKPWDNVEELVNDPRIGKRVFCLSLLPEVETYGTIKKITRCSNKNELPSHAVEYWRVQADIGMNIETISPSFELYEHATEFQSGDRVRHNIDEGGYWEGVILRPIVATDHLRFVVRIEDVQTRIKIPSGSEEAHRPSRLTKI